MMMMMMLSSTIYSKVAQIFRCQTPLHLQNTNTCDGKSERQENFELATNQIKINQIISKERGQKRGFSSIAPDLRVTRTTLKQQGNGSFSFLLESVLTWGGGGGRIGLKETPTLQWWKTLVLYVCCPTTRIEKEFCRLFCGSFSLNFSSNGYNFRKSWR